MEQIVPVNFDTQTVSARELHKSLGIRKRFSEWFETNSQGFEENEDFSRAYLKVQANRYGGEQEIEDYSMSVDMAKHICLMSRTEKGKQCRQYLIDVEKAWNTPEQIMARALQMANTTIQSLKDSNNALLADNDRMKPKEIFADAVATSKESILIGNLAKLIKQNGVDIGQNRLFDWMYDNGYLIKSGERRRMPTQKSMDMKLFEVKERTIDNPDGSVRLTRTTKVTGKGQQYFINKFLCKTDKTV